MLSTLFITGCLFIATTSARYFDHFITVILENQPAKSVMKDSYFKSLLSEGVSFTNFNALRNPSYPNYLGMIGGSTFGITNDKQKDLNERTLADLLEEKNLDWRGYAENYRGNCFLGTSEGKYARKHVPFLSFVPITSNSTRCAKVVNSKEFMRDWNLNHLPEYAMYVPNMDNDGHDTSLSFASKWLKQFLTPLLANVERMNNTVILVTFDEGKKGNNQIYSVMIGSTISKNSQFTQKTNHYNILKLVEDNFEVGHLDRNDVSAESVVAIFG